MDWVRVLEKKSAERRIGVWLRLDETADGLALTLTDEDGHSATAERCPAHRGGERRRAGRRSGCVRT